MTRCDEAMTRQLRSERTISASSASIDAIRRCDEGMCIPDQAKRWRECGIAFPTETVRRTRQRISQPVIDDRTTRRDDRRACGVDAGTCLANASPPKGHRSGRGRRRDAVIDRSASPTRRSDRAAKASASRCHRNRTVSAAMRTRVERIAPGARGNQSLAGEKRTPMDVILTRPRSIRTRSCASATQRRASVHPVA